MDLVTVIIDATTSLATTIDMFDNRIIHSVEWLCQ